MNVSRLNFEVLKRDVLATTLPPRTNLKMLCSVFGAYFLLKE